MVAESAPALVVVGESDGAAAALLSTLVHGARGGSEGANEASSDDLEGPGPHALRLDTKYYTVDVAATVHTLPDESSTGDGNTHGECPEAVVAVFDPTKDGSFAKITKWCQARDPSWSPEIRLLVCRYPTKDALDAEASSSADKADDWAVENGYEAVAVIASGGAADETLELHGDAQGTRRVRAALEAHMWPGLTMKRGDEASASVVSVLSKKEEAGGTIEEEDETPGGPDDDFERMLGEMTRVRAMGANASDSERRAMAADAAMMMMSRFGIFESDDDSDEDEGATAGAA